MDKQLMKLPSAFSQLFQLKGMNPSLNRSKNYDAAKTPYGKWKDVSLSQEQQEAVLQKDGWLGLQIPNGFILVDVDNAEQGALLYDLLICEGFDFHAIKSPNGYQFFFKDVGSVEKQNVKVHCLLGIPIDYRLAGKGYIVVPTENTEGREWLQVCSNELDPLPFFLTNVGEFKGEALNKVPTVPLQEGSRNATMLEWALALRTRNVSKERVREVIELFNAYFTSPSLDTGELENTIFKTLGASSSGYEYKMKNICEEFDLDADAFDLEDEDQAADPDEDETKGFFSKNGFEAAKLADMLRKSLPIVCMNETLYVYENGIYKRDDEKKIERIVVQILGKRFKTAYVREVINYLKIVCVISEKDIAKTKDIINVKNGLLHWRTGELKPHRSDFISFSQIPVVYDPEAVCPSIDKFVAEVVPADTISIVFEWIGLCLIPETKYGKAVITTGTGANGKSVLINLIETFIGKMNISNVSMQDLERNRFKLAQLQHKLMNIHSDIPRTALEKTDNFKVVVTGERVNAEKKGVDAFDFTPYARLMYSANEIPRSFDTSEGFLRRLIIINFPNKFEGAKADVNLLDKLTTKSELSGLLNKAIAALAELDKRGRFEENESTRSALHEYKQSNDPVEAFLNEMCIVAEKLSIEAQQLFDAYRFYMSDSGLKAKGRTNFYKDLNSKGFERKRTNSMEPFKFIGLDLIERNFSKMTDDDLLS